LISEIFSGESGIIHSSNDRTVFLYTDNIPMKDIGTLNTQDTHDEAYSMENEPQTVMDELLRSNKILDTE
jgi:hypothetical protein